MHTLTEIIKSLSKPKIINPLVSLSSFKGMAELIRQSKKPINLPDLTGISNITKSIALNIQPIIKSKSILENRFNSNALFDQIKPIDINKFAFGGLTSSLDHIFRYNKELSNSLAGVASSQLILSSNLKQISQSIQNSHLNEFNSLEVAIQGITNGYLRESVKSKEWEDIVIVEEVNETMSAVSKNLISKSGYVTQIDLLEFGKIIISDLSNLLKKSKSERVKLFIFDLMAIISFILSMHGLYKSSNSITNQDVIDITKKEIDKIKQDLIKQIDFKFKNYYKTRVSQTDVKLMFSNKKKSKLLGVVKKGQQITVIEIRHKWLLISFLDNETGEPKSGFVIKKYFKINK